MLVLDLVGLRASLPAAEITGVALLLAVAVGINRSRPATALGLATAALVGQGMAELYGLVAPFAMSYGIPAAVLAFLAGRRTERVTPVILVFASACAVTFVLYATRWVMGGDLRATLSGLVDWASAVLILLLVVVTPWLFGRFWRQHVMLRTAGWEVAERMERSREVEAEHARLRERARIATEMHDSLGHDLTLIGVRAAAMEVAGDATDEQRESAAELRASAHQATLRLREIIGVLRAEAAPEPAEPAGEDISTVVDRAVAAGMDARLVREGPDLDPASPTGRAAHRVVQEALTNAARHAPGARVTVHVTRESGVTTVRVSDTGPADPAAGPSEGSGSGLAGLRALIEGMGGTFHAGTAGDDAGFAVTARVDDTAEGTDPAVAGQRGADTASETERTRSRVRGRAQRRLVTALTIPAGTASVVTALGFLLLSYVGNNAVLPPSEYAKLHVGDDQAEVQRVLPRFEHPQHSLAGQPPVPDGATCRYYTVRSENGLPPVYRLCFADGELVSKDVLQQE
ncbi:signal transduction histidine kinase [Lipingzhangella halophila]|uniref:histidine kinase n=1 Tax=Lipingzhangella halophila TaxID=1783352 RepID=A0A7W7W567_9ACTN|nr:signal transduction histidine kinase [Lipingzhangella halophila]